MVRGDAGSDEVQRRLWKPVWNIFEEQFVPGRKTDQGDAERIAPLL
jgi:hypothetical protein